ncbi:IclR family transcriptional regulator [Cupriavidus sp. 30B13]|uniref:IclR family transcriptional regulator n=1 Tax=Cupriavidus sp. 30B13 TaxID=3384241 RepID=UPI003B8FA09C
MAGPDSQEKKMRDGAGSFSRSLEVLELFSIEQRPLTVGTVAARLGYPQSSTSVLLNQLAQRGYLTHQRADRTYFPTARVMFLGMWMQHHFRHGENLGRMVEAIATATGRIVRLGMQNGLQVQYVRTEAGRPVNLDLLPGQLRPLCRSAVGKMLLSTKTRDEVQRLVRHINAVETDYEEPVDFETLWAELETSRRTGFAESVDGVLRGNSAVAMLIPSQGWDVPLSISVVLPTSKLEALREPTLAAMHDAIRRFLFGT